MAEALSSRITVSPFRSFLPETRDSSSTCTWEMQTRGLSAEVVGKVLASFHFPSAQSPQPRGSPEGPLCGVLGALPHQRLCPPTLPPPHVSASVLGGTAGVSPFSPRPCALRGHRVTDPSLKLRGPCAKNASSKPGLKTLPAYGGTRLLFERREPLKTPFPHCRPLQRSGPRRLRPFLWISCSVAGRGADSRVSASLLFRFI